MTAPVLTTDRLTLGPFTLDHFEPLAAFFASERSQFVGGPKDREATWRHLGLEIGHWALRGYGRFAVTETATGKLVGNIGPWNPESWPEPEIGWDLMAGFEGRGYATEAARATRDWCYSTLGWTTVMSFIEPANTASARVATRLGAQYERDFQHPRIGALQIWRHPGPEDGTP